MITVLKYCSTLLFNTLYEKSEALHLVKPGLMAGRPARGQDGRQADEMLVKLDF